MRWSASASPIDLARAVDGAVGRLAGDLGPAVAVEVVDHELRVVGAFADVLAQVDPPEPRAVELVGFEDRLRGAAALRVVAAAADLMDDDFVLAVAVEVADRGVVGRVALRRLQRDRQIRLSRGVGREREFAAGGLSLPLRIGRTSQELACWRSALVSTK